MAGFPSEAQAKIIEAPKANILVSAAAGSGKTAVMTARIIDRIISGETRLENTLVLTFTNAASESMERKIRQAILKARDQALDAGDEKGYQLLDSQVLALQSAHIQTIHAFCLWLIQNFPYEVVDDAGKSIIDASFQIMDDKLAKDTLAEAIAAVFHEEYLEAKAGNNPLFLQLLDNYSSAKSDNNLRLLFTQTHNYLRSLANYRDVLSDYLNSLRKDSAHFEQAPHIKYLYRELRLRIDFALQKADDLLLELNNRTWLFAKSIDSDSAHDARIRTAIEKLKLADNLLLAWEESPEENQIWHMLYSLFDGFEWKKPVVRNQDGGKEFVEEFCQYFMDFLHSFMQCSEGQLKPYQNFPAMPIVTMPMEKIEEGLQRSLPAIEKYCEVLLKIDDAYQDLKRERQMIDFSDYEHFALLILEQVDGGRFCREHFKEVYIDEYQDTSSIQESILQKISPNSLFMVGDVKQSIYRFRHARPETFLAKAKDIQNESIPGLYFLLQENFRSTDGVLKAINDVFQRLMTSEFTGIDYLDGHAMVTGREDTKTAAQVELISFVNNNDTPSSRLDEADAEFLQLHLSREFGAYAAYRMMRANLAEQNLYAIALKMKHLHENEGVAYKKMAIMARGNYTCDLAAQVLSNLAIPQNRQVKANVHDTYLLQVQVSLLQIIDNPRQDIPLTTVLLSDVLSVPFAESELMQMKLWHKSQGFRSEFYDVLTAYSTKDTPLAQKTRQFLETLQRWRKLEKHLSPKALLESIYAEDEYLAKVTASEGAIGQDFIEEFLNTLETLQAQGRKNLYQVLRYFEERLEAEDKVKADNDFSGDGVHIVTFHGSKGLEFEHVFLLDLHKRLEDKDQRHKLVLQEDLGIGFDVLSADGSYTYQSHLRLAMQNKQRERYLTEEICLLYVAMSRAQEKLYLCFQFDEAETSEDGEEAGFNLPAQLEFLLDKSAELSEVAIPTSLLQGIRSYQDMLLMALIAHPSTDIQAFFSSAFPAKSWNIHPASSHFYFNEESVWSCSEPQDLDKLIERFRMLRRVKAEPSLPHVEEDTSNSLDSTEAGDANPNLNTLNRLPKVPEDKENYYKYVPDAPRFVKQSVSEIKRQSQQMEKNEDSTYSNLNLKLFSLDETDTEDSFSASEVGTILHSFMRFINLSALNRSELSLHDIDKQIHDFTKLGYFDAKEEAVLKRYRDAFLMYLKSDLAKRVLAAEQSAQAFHELPFTFRYKENEETLLVQGMIDLWFVEDEVVTLVDYKSDFIRHGEIRQVFLERYAVQLKMYALALESALKTHVEDIQIWSIREAKAYAFSREELGLS